ncbi:hypothetical protein [Terrihabitans sp. B22-R8]|uniref:hypothetical protein n=1 Tax=Terrihabitans sp. B22-R8 TaxID=3425128 RepID=UPI00403CAC98
MPAQSQAILYLTHIRSRRVLAHIERLKRETAHLMPVFVCTDERQWRCDTCPDFPSDFRVDPADWEQIAPARARHSRHGPITDYYDLFYLPALTSERLAEFSHIWFIENDVDFAGNWRDFFEPAEQCTADLLTTTIHARAAHPWWSHWRRFRTPDCIARERQLRAFLPLARFSRPMIDAYAEEVRNPEWKGHFEAMWPTLAQERGLTLADLGGEGPFRWDGPSFYRNSFRKRSMSPGNFVFRPARRAYVHEDPDAFAEKGQLYHPVKGW